MARKAEVANEVYFPIFATTPGCLRGELVEEGLLITSLGCRRVVD